MKKFGIFFIAATFVLMFGCKEAVMDLDAEKKAIIEVINAETQAYMDYDFEKVISYYVQDSMNFRLTTGADDHIFIEGWDAIKNFFEEDLLNSDAEGHEDTHISVTKDNYRIKVYENSAYVICTERWTYNTPDNVIEIDSRQVRFMEKEDGEWKIAFLSFIGTSGYDAEEELEELGVEFNTVL